MCRNVYAVKRQVWKRNKFQVNTEELNPGLNVEVRCIYACDRARFRCHPHTDINRRINTKKKKKSSSDP